MVVADTTTGRVITREAFSRNGGGLDAFDNIPPAFEPAPFSWDHSGRLLLVATTQAGSFVKTFDANDGAVTRTLGAPDGLQQVALLTP